MGGCLAKEDGNSRGSAVVPYSSPPAKKNKPRLHLYATEICPIANSIRIALEFKGLPVEIFWLRSRAADNRDEEKDLRTRNKQLLLELQYMLPAGFDLEDDGELPILQHDDRTMSASRNDILAYLEANFPKPSLRSSGGKAIAKDCQNWIDFVRHSFGPTIIKALYNADLAPQHDVEKLLDAAFAKLNAAIAKGGGPFFLGSRFSLVDVHLIPLLALLRPLAYAQGIEMSPAYSHLKGYVARMEGFAGYAPVKMDEEMLKDHVCGVLARNAPPPLVAMTILQHQSMLEHFEKLILTLDEIITIVASNSPRIVIDPAKGSITMQIKKLSAQYSSLLELMLEHAQMEERLIFPVLDKADRDITTSANRSHAKHLPLMNGIKEDFKAAVSIEQGNPGVKETLQGIASRLRTLQAQNEEHFCEEETELLPLLKAAGLGSKQQGEHVSKCVEVMESTHGNKFTFLLSGMRPHQIQRYMSLIQDSTEREMKKESLKRLMTWMKKEESEDEEKSYVWKTVKCRLPVLAAIAT